MPYYLCIFRQPRDVGIARIAAHRRGTGRSRSPKRMRARLGLVPMPPIVNYAPQHARRAAWWRRSRTSAMSSIRSGRGAALRGGGAQVDVPEQGGDLVHGTPALRRRVAR